MKSALEPIDLDESKLMTKLEAQIRSGVQGAGDALMTIRDRRLYRSEHETFEAYCHAVWGMGRAHAYRLIEYSEVKMSPIGDKIANEAQAREVVKAPVEKRAQVVEVAETKAEAEKRPMTAADVKEARIEVCGPPAADPAANEAQEAPAPVLIVDPSITRLSKNIFAIQVEERIDQAISDGSVDQLKCVKLALEVGLRKVSAAINQKRQV